MHEALVIVYGGGFWHWRISGPCVSDVRVLFFAVDAITIYVASVASFGEAELSRATAYFVACGCHTMKRQEPEYGLLLGCMGCSERDTPTPGNIFLFLCSSLGVLG